VLVSLLVCLIPTTIGGLLSAIGIAGMDRLVQYNVLAMSGAPSRLRATSTCCSSTKPEPSPSQSPGHRVHPGPDVTAERLADAAQLSSLSDETPKAAPSSCWPRRSTTCADAT